MPESRRKKLIEVALPLEAINRESAREKSIRHGHPSTMHLWWARRPLAACRAVLFSSIVDDPSSRPEEFPTEEDQERERQRLFRIIEELVKWENTANEAVLDLAHAEIRSASHANPPPVVDPFCGGGSIPLEAQRLGLRAHAGDLNPVAVLITKALVEIPPHFADDPPVNPEGQSQLKLGKSWRRAEGLAEDVRYYGRWMQEQAFDRIGHLYPRAKLSNGREAVVIAWLWARTVRCPNPACGADMPVVRSFALSAKKGKEWHVVPRVRGGEVSFTVEEGPAGRSGTKERGAVECLVCGSTFDDSTLRRQSRTHGISTRLMAVVAEGKPQRLYLDPAGCTPAVPRHEADWLDQALPDNTRWFSPPLYGMTTYGDLFTNRQLIALTTFSDLVREVRSRVSSDCGNESYADAIATYLAFAVDRSANYWSSLTPWAGDFIVQTFGRQALPMVWDFAEANPFSRSTGNWIGAVEWISKCIEVAMPARGEGIIEQLDARAAIAGVDKPMVCTDPPYYDNIGYADLSDFFYLWLRRSIGFAYPRIFSTLLTPKEQELIASPYRFGGNKHEAEAFFEEGLGRAFARIRAAQHPSYPVAFFYAFKQAESIDGAVASTGWDTMLTGLLASDFSVTGTWPVRSERDQGLKTGTNALASSIVLVCRPRSADAPIATRRELVAALRTELPSALKRLQRGNIAPVDLSQAAIGPGMAVFSRYAKVLESDGTPMSVRSALALINQALDEILAEQEGDFDADTRFAITWFEQRAWDEGPYGEADVLARAKNTSTTGLVEAGILRSGAGKVRLLRRDELSGGWDPVLDSRPTIWEATQHLTKRLAEEGENEAAALLQRMGGLGESARELAYRLYATSERKGLTQESLAYNALVVAWPEIARQVAGTPEAAAQQALDV